MLAQKCVWLVSLLNNACPKICLPMKSNCAKCTLLCLLVKCVFYVFFYPLLTALKRVSKWNKCYFG